MKLLNKIKLSENELIMIHKPILLCLENRRSLKIKKIIHKINE
jgi:hypothetical protein